MYASICSTEKWHREGDVFCKHNGKYFNVGVVCWNENSDTLTVNWDESVDINKAIYYQSATDFSDIDFKKTFLIDQNFSLGETVVDERHQQLGQVVGKSWIACASIFDTNYVIPNIPSELLTPEAILEGRKVLLRGWIGEITRIFWEVTVQKESKEKDTIQLKHIKESNIDYCSLRKKIIPAVGQTITISSKEKPCLVEERKLFGVYVNWYHRLQFYTGSVSPSSPTPPPRKIRDPQLLSEMVDFDWINYNYCKKHTLCTYTIRDTDVFLSEDWEDVILKEMTGMSSNSIPCKRKKRDTPFNIGDKVLVNVLRIFNVAHVEWQQDGNSDNTLEIIYSKDIKHQNRFITRELGRFKNFVSHKVSFGSSKMKTLGVTLGRNETDETVFVNWLSTSTATSNIKPEKESKHNLISHKYFGDIQIGQCVERSRSCTHKDFCIGIVQDITADGYVNVVMDAGGQNMAKLIPSDIIICPLPSQKNKIEEFLQSVKFETVQPVLSVYQPEFFKALQRDDKLVKNYALTNPGIEISSLINTNFCSILLYGPERTPYENGIFIFQFQFPHSYPFSPPIVKMTPLFQNQINFHCSLNGTLFRKLNGEMLTFPSPLCWSEDVTLLDIVLTIKGFMFYAEPFLHSFHDWDNGLSSFDIERIKIHRKDCLRQFNAKVVIEIVDSLLHLKYAINENSTIREWKPTIVNHLKITLPKLQIRIKNWINSSSILPLADEYKPRFELLPFSQGLKMAIRQRIEHLDFSQNTQLEYLHEENFQNKTFEPLQDHLYPFLHDSV